MVEAISVQNAHPYLPSLATASGFSEIVVSPFKPLETDLAIALFGAVKIVWLENNQESARTQIILSGAFGDKALREMGVTRMNCAESFITLPTVIGQRVAEPFQEAVGMLTGEIYQWLIENNHYSSTGFVPKTHEDHLRDIKAFSGLVGKVATLEEILAFNKQVRLDSVKLG